MQDEGKQSDSLPPLSSAPSPVVGTFVSQPATTPSKFRVFSTINVIGIVLIISIIAGTSLFLFHHNTTAVGGTNLSSKAIVSTALQRCLLNLQNDDDGLSYVCKHHLYQSTQRTLRVGNVTVTVEQEYADMNRVALAYSVREGTHNVTQGTQLEMTMLAWASIVFGNVFGQSIIANNGNASSYPTQPLSNVKTLDVQLKVGLLGGNPSSITTFSLPLHTEQHMLSIHQKVIANGIGLTLESGNISLSQANFSLVFSQDLRSIHAIVGPPSLTVNNINIRCSSSGNGLHNTYNLQFPCPLFYQTGKWTIQVTAINMQNGSRLTPWVFTFDVL